MTNDTKLLLLKNMVEQTDLMLKNMEGRTLSTGVRMLSGLMDKY